MVIPDIDLIMKIVWSYHHTTGLNWDDLFQEAVLAYFESLKKYDPKRGKITTFIWHCLQSRLRNYVKKEYEFYEKIEPIEISIDLPEEKVGIFECLSIDANKILSTLLNFPDSISMDPGKIKKKINDFFTEVGWNELRIKSVINELESI